MLRQLCRLILFAAVFGSFLEFGESVWISEDFWSIVDYSGNLRDGRTIDDFIRFKGDDVDVFVAYWIIHTDNNQFEAYGEAYLKNEKICARFIDEMDKPAEICAGFRVLSRGKTDFSNPFEWYPIRDVVERNTVEYVHHQIAQVFHDNHLQSVYGGAHLNRGLAYAVNINGTSLHIIKDSDPEFYNSNVELLVIREGYAPRQVYEMEKKRCRHRHGPLLTPDDLTSPFNIRSSHPNPNECQSTRYDTNGDGYVDPQELHACRYGRVGCDIRIYDSNHDGFLDAEELAECRRVLESDKYVRYCQDLYFDTNRDGIVDFYELEGCLNRHDPSRRREFRRLRRKAKKEFEAEDEAKDEAESVESQEA